MSKDKDDLEAVRAVVEALEGFTPDVQKRIIRWALERVGTTLGLNLENEQTQSPTNVSSNSSSITDIKTFIASKNPQSDSHFATAVAYYYKFQAPASERRDSINSETLQDACRKVNRDRLKDSYKTLHNTHGSGFLDKGSEKGSFAINTVGENLVAMALPNAGAKTTKKNKRK